MSKTKLWLVIATSLVLVGLIIFGGVMMALKWDFRRLSTVKYENNVHEILEDYENIRIVTDTSNILLVPAEDGKTTITCYEQTRMAHSVTVQDGTLVIEPEDTRKWYDYIGFDFNTPKITVAIPQGEYGSLSVKVSTGKVDIPEAFVFENIDIEGSTGDTTIKACATGAIRIKRSTGDIHVENVTAASLTLAVTTGRVTVSNASCTGDVTITASTGNATLGDISCKNLVSSANTGRLTLSNVVATESFDIRTSTGDVKFNDCDAAQIYVRTGTGDVCGTLLSEKVFMPRTNTGDVEVPRTVTGGRCEITTDTGDIRITLKQ